MKNLKDEIEGILSALLNTYTLEDEQSEGVGKLALEEAIEALTSLIEQEKERTVREFALSFDKANRELMESEEE